MLGQNENTREGKGRMAPETRTNGFQTREIYLCGFAIAPGFAIWRQLQNGSPGGTTRCKRVVGSITIIHFNSWVPPESHISRYSLLTYYRSGLQHIKLRSWAIAEKGQFMCISEVNQYLPPHPFPYLHTNGPKLTELSSLYWTTVKMQARRQREDRGIAKKAI